MSATNSPDKSLRSALLATTGLIAGTVMLNAIATQYVAYRVGYHPAIGAPLFGRIYAPWDWIAWQQAAWAVNARHTFQIVYAGLFGSCVAALGGGLAYTAS